MANRKRIEMNQRIFERLIASAQQRGVAIANETQDRFIRRLSDDDAELMSKGDAKALVISRQVRMVSVSFKDERYFCVFGLAEPESIPLGLEQTELTPALFSIAVLEAAIQPPSSVSGSKIREKIEDYFRGSSDYDGHELDEIADLFPRVIAYRVVVPELEIFDSEYRVLGALLARSYAEGPIQISAQTLEKIWNAFETGSKFIPYRNLVQGLMAISWEGLFLETYRCLEQLYAAPRVSELTSKWRSTLPLRDIVTLLEEHLSWRPKEDEALTRLLAMCDTITVQSLCQAFEVESLPQTDQARAELASRKVYSLRNNVVHFRPIHEVIDKSNDQWNSIVAMLVDVVSHVYEVRGTQFFISDAQPHETTS